MKMVLMNMLVHVSTDLKEHIVKLVRYVFDKDYEFKLIYLSVGLQITVRL